MTACIHDDCGHRCGVCNTVPQLVRVAPAPAQLYHHTKASA